LFRSLLEESHFSPLIDLEKNDKTGLIRLVDHNCLGQPQSALRLETLETNIIKYFRARDEDNIKKPLPTTDTLITRPITASSHEVFHSVGEISSRIEDSKNSINSINSSFWNYPSKYQSHDQNETVY
jgi:hypothetical protein